MNNNNLSGCVELLTIEDKIKLESFNKIGELKVDVETISWINLQGGDFQKNIEVLNEKLNIHPLILGDIFEKTQRTKVEKYDDLIFMVLHLVKLDEKNENLIAYDDLYLFVKDKIIITLTRENNQLFSKLNKKLLISNKENFNSANKLLFSIIYEIVENYYDVFEEIEVKIDKLDSELIKNSDYDIIDELYLLRRNMIYMIKYVTPLKNLVEYIYDISEEKKERQTKYYYRDINDSIDDIIESIEVYKELASNMIDIVNNMVSDKTNDITKILTIWSTIFLPTTFLSGVFGMNFRYMRGLEWEYSYPIFWLISIILMIIMIIYFKKKKWF
ncbi:magnesium/cobalt transporter CorA [Miniphocaeibacter halophilus]|uniref:Magnesium/cobalt transporter CorA n=1 Tax=Miniphocaeibacter halophilus TaxID=2931922 RepID=A0AC61MSA2_9FIRM|nr:magnesium/cobalt transporter CorA [Miniphocaeibacter halophilus]QQK08555.1 magnesium/cobalt transporter CorA [Miniphocaeibacter halophilus]